MENNKLETLVQQIFSLRKAGKHFPVGSNNDDLLLSEDLMPWLDELKLCDEFQQTDNLELLSLEKATTTKDETGTNLLTKAVTIKLKDGIKFLGSCKIISIFQSPVMYDPIQIHQVVHDNAVITPVLHDQETFKPFKEITIRFSAKDMQDNFLKSKNNYIKH